VPAFASRGHLDRDCSDHRLLGHVCPQQLGFARQSPILRCTDDVFGFQLVRFSQKLKDVGFPIGNRDQAHAHITKMPF
jgi:hypothetical protein